MNNFKHVDEAVAWGWRTSYCAYFMDPGTGKTRVTLLDGLKNFQAGKIEAIVVIAKNSGKTNWVIWDHMIEDPKEDQDQVSQVLGSDVIKGVWISGATGKDKKCWREFEKAIDKPTKLIVLALNYEALLSEQLFAFLEAFMAKFRVMLVCDESTRIGEAGSKRTKRATKLSKIAVKKRILSGTPIIKRPMKIYSQGRFLSPDALGFTSLYSFRNRYAVMGGFQGRKVIDYKNLDELADKIARWAFFAKAEDCLDLPKRTFRKHRIEMTKEQVKAYQEMRETFLTEVKGTEITATIVLTQMMRLQQILGGYATDPSGNVIEIIPPERNPKFLEALDIIEDAPGQFMWWAVHRPEIDGFARLLKEREISFYEFHGGITDTEERVRIRKSFKRGERQGVLATAATGGDSIDEFKVATTVMYNSNDFDTEKRVQSERRNWRAGMDVSKPVCYHDILIPNTVDTKIIRVLRGDAELSARVLREQWREWI